jgi:hypothetical protein
MVPPIKLSEGEELVVRETSDFIGFGEEILGKRYHHVQRDVLAAAFKEGFCGSFVSCNDGGKTREVFATIILGSLFLFPNGRVMSTSGAFRQIKDQLNPELQKFRTLFPGWEFQDCRINTRNPNCFWHGFATNDAGKFEGQHEGDRAKGEYLTLLFDEGKTIKDPVFLAGDRCRTTRRLYASSAGFAQGEFYASHTIRKAFFQTFKQRADQCPHIPQERIEMLRKKWGPDHVLVKSALDAEFMPFVEGAVIQLQALDMLLANPPVFHDNGQVKAFCDFAWSESASGDENVLALRRGNKITLEACFRAKGRDAVAARFIQEFNRIPGLKPWMIEGDASGEGANIIKTLRAMGWSIGSCNNGDKPRWSDHYENLVSEMWCEGGQAIIDGKFILPDDAELYGQMLNRRIVPTRTGRLVIESKHAMRDTNREGGAVSCSPDRADAVFGAMAPLPQYTPRQVMGQTENQNLDAPQSKANPFGRAKPVWGDGPEANYIPGTYCG